MKHDAHVRSYFLKYFPFKFYFLSIFAFFLLGFAISTVYHGWFYQDILLKMSNFK